MKYGKWRIFLVSMLATILLALGFSLAPVFASAETVPEESTSETVVNSEDENVEKDELKNVVEPIICGIASLIGTGLLQLFFGGKLGSLTKSFNDVTTWVKDKKEELSNEEVDLKKFKDDLLAAVSANEEVKEMLTKAYERNKEEYDTLHTVINNTVETVSSMVKDMQTCYEKRAETIEKQYTQIKDILIKLAVGNADLIRNGIADKIVEILEKDKEGEDEG